MVAAVSSAVLQNRSTAAEGSPSCYHWFKMPDLNRATHRRLGQKGAGWTFETICRLVHHVSRVGKPRARKAARELGSLGVGLQAIADEAGVSVAKVRRDLVNLVDLGLVSVSRRNVTFKVDPATGRIRENRTGRSLPVIVSITVGPEHCRTKAGQDRQAASPTISAGQASPNRDHSGGAIQRDCETERGPDGDAVALGTPPAEPGAGLTAGEPQAAVSHAVATGRLENAKQGRQEAAKAGGHSAAKAGQERVIVREDDPHDGLPVPVGRISLPAKPQEKPRKKWMPEDHDIESRVWRGNDEARFAATRKRLEAEQAKRDAEDAAWRKAAESAA